MEEVNTTVWVEPACRFPDAGNDVYVVMQDAEEFDTDGTEYANVPFIVENVILFEVEV